MSTADIVFGHGDTGTDLVVSLKETDGTAYDVTGATGIVLLGREVGGNGALSVNGSINGDATGGQFRFEDVGNAHAPDATRREAVFVCAVRWVQSTETHYGRTTFRVRIRRLP